MRNTGTVLFYQFHGLGRRWRNGSIFSGIFVQKYRTEFRPEFRTKIRTEFRTKFRTEFRTKFRTEFRTKFRSEYNYALKFEN